jgi:hypothetical protein
MQKTRATYRMDDKVAERVAKQYEKLMEEHGGRLTPKKDGEVPFVYPAIVDSSSSSSNVVGGEGSGGGVVGETKDAIKARRAAEREKARSEKAEAKARSRADRIEARDRVRAEKKAAAMERSSAERTEATAVAAASSVEAASGTTSDVVGTTVATLIAEDGITDDGIAELTKAGGGDDIVVVARGRRDLLSVVRSRATPKNVGAVVVTGGTVAYGYNYYRENNPAARSERERQLRLILGSDVDDDEDDEDDDDDEDG